MARFTAEYALEYRERDLQTTSCRIGDNIWVLQWFVKRPMEMRRFNLNTKQWHKIAVSNGNIVRHDGVKFIATSWNQKILLARYKSSLNTEIFVFDTVSLNWAHLVNLPTGVIDPLMFILEDTMYTISGRVDLTMICLRRFEITSVDWPEFGNGDFRSKNSISLAELNGLVYAIKLQTADGIRNVYQYDKHNRKFIDIHEECQSYITRSEYKLPYRIWTWSHNNKIYQGFHDVEEDFLIIDSFDIKENRWHTIFKSTYFGNILGVYCTDNTIHVVTHIPPCEGYRNITRVTIREIDQLPSLEVLSLVQLNVHFIANRTVEHMKFLKGSMPQCVWNQFEKTFGFMLRDLWRRNEKEHRLKYPEHYESLGM